MQVIDASRTRGIREQKLRQSRRRMKAQADGGGWEWQPVQERFLAASQPVFCD